MKKKFYVIETDKDISDKKISIVSDFHISCNTPDKKIIEVLETLEQLKPTHIFIPGDLYNADYSTFSLSNNPVKNFIDNATDIADVYYVKGNIEQRSDRSPFGVYNSINPKFHFLNDHYSIGKNICLNNYYIYVDGDMKVSGILLPQNFYSYSDEEKVHHITSQFGNSLKELSSDNEKFNVLLCHDPIIKDVLDEMGCFDLVVAGHNHGGLFPKWMKGFFAHSGVDMEKLYPKYIKGMLPCGNGYMIVSEGITKFHSESGKLERLEVFHDGTIETVRVRTRK